jgi:lipopolysaccharide/colanic/teichoic acid biosynthesis glycosyltransferase
MIRLFDIVISIFGIILLFPLFIIISIFIALEFNGGILFIQERVGKNGTHFRIFKFRTMVTNQPEGLSLTVSNDKRITKFGKFLRANKLDELPQLFNVIKGDMSLVGPRPEVPEYVKYYSQEQRQILSLKPGITDLASIEFSNENYILAEVTDPEQYYISHIMPRKINLNLVYLQNKNLKNYFKIIFKTIKLIFK